jgi:pimeloyl-ACP methyl ester carboxylesterase
MNGHVLLVGHSYGGAVITQAGGNPKVEGLVYVAAYGPDQGESVLSLGATFPATPIMNDFTQDATGFLKLTAAGVAADFAQDLTPAEQAGITVTQGPTNAPNALAGTISATPAWKTLPSWYVIASNDRVIGPALEQTMATRMKAAVLNVSSSHVAMLAQPAAVTTFIEKAAATLAP